MTIGLLARAKQLISPALDAPPPAENDHDGDDGAAKRRRARLVWISAAVLAGACVVIYVATHFLGGAGAPPVAVDQTQVVTVAQLREHPFKPRVSLMGEVRPRRDIHVFAPVSGVRVLQLLKDEGDMVRAGQPLARLDALISSAQIRAAEANVAEADAAALRARDEFARAESIRDSGALSNEAIEQRRAAAVAANARLAAARAQLQEVNARLQGGYVRAPIGGLIISRSVQLGALVDGQEMFRIAGDNALEVRADISEADVLSLRRGQSAVFRLADGGTVEGRLTRAPASIDERTRVGEALFALPANTSVRAGMHLSGEIALAERQALAVEQAAVRYEGGRAYVFTVGDDNIARQTFVQIGARDGNMVEVQSGLDAGARVVGAGAAFLRDGDRVRAIEREAANAPDRGQLRGRAG